MTEPFCQNPLCSFHQIQDEAANHNEFLRYNHVNPDGSCSERVIRRLTISNYSYAMQTDPPTAVVCEICATAINLIL